MYVFDNYSDIQRYATFKKEVEKPYLLSSDDEDFNLSIGGTTPIYFPIFTETDQEILKKRTETFFDTPAMTYFRSELETSSYGSHLYPTYYPYYEYYKYLLSNYVKSLTERFPSSSCEHCLLQQFNGFSSACNSNNSNSYQKPNPFDNPWLPWWILKENL